MMITLAVKTLVQIVKKEKGDEVAHINCSVQLALVFYITITFLVYAIMLSGTMFSMVNNPQMGIKLVVANILVHYIVPIMAIIDWIAFMPHKTVSYKKVWSFLLYPIFYLILITSRAGIQKTKIFVVGKTAAGEVVRSRYPYPFMDFDVLGYWMILIILGMALAYAGLGLLYILMDKKLPNKNLVKKESHLYGNEV